MVHVTSAPPEGTGNGSGPGGAAHPGSGVPTLISRTSERVSGFVEGVEGTQPELRESTTYAAEATVDSGEPAVSPETEEYLSKVKETNVGAVEAFLKVDEEIRQFDSITPEDIEDMEANRNEVRTNLDQIEALDPPEEYQEQIRVVDMYGRIIGAAVGQLQGSGFQRGRRAYLRLLLRRVCVRLDTERSLGAVSLRTRLRREAVLCPLASLWMPHTLPSRQR